MLKAACTSEAVIELGDEKINQIWRNAKLRAVGMKRTTILCETAKRSVGLKIGSSAARYEMKMLPADYEYKKAQLESVMKEIGRGVQKETRKRANACHQRYGTDHRGRFSGGGRRCKTFRVAKTYPETYGALVRGKLFGKAQDTDDHKQKRSKQATSHTVQCDNHADSDKSGVLVTARVLRDTCERTLCKKTVGDSNWLQTDASILRRPGKGCDL